MSGKVVHFEVAYGDGLRADRGYPGCGIGSPAYFKDVEGDLMGLWQARTQG